jgi:hypothetical protein
MLTLLHVFTIYFCCACFDDLDSIASVPVALICAGDARTISFCHALVGDHDSEAASTAASTYAASIPSPAAAAAAAGDLDGLAADTAASTCGSCTCAVYPCAASTLSSAAAGSRDWL